MRTRDFENAIDALACNIFIDEMRLTRNQVHDVYGHTIKAYLMWDSFGRGYSVRIDEIPGEPIDDLPTDQVLETKDIAGGMWKRDEKYDLRF